MKMFRCTRPCAYGPGTPGHRDSRSRQGYYIRARDEDCARRKMREKFPEDMGVFDVEEWDTPMPEEI